MLLSSSRSSFVFFFLQNISGTFTAFINLISQIMAPNARTAAIYYFITALFILLACFDTYFALPLNVRTCFFLYLMDLLLMKNRKTRKHIINFVIVSKRFYRYHELLHQKELNKRQLESNTRGKKEELPYWKIVSKCSSQLFNIFVVFFVTLALFPSVQSDIKRSSAEFIVPNDFYVSVMCFLTFNVTAMIGSSIASIVQWVI